MARFLFAAWPIAGHINPCMAVAHALRARGHDTAIYTGNTARIEIEESGCLFFPFQRVDAGALHAAEHPHAYSESVFERLRAVRDLKRGLRQWLVDTIPAQVMDLSDVLEEWDADVIITVESMWGPLLVLRETQELPVAVLSTFAACLLPGPEVPAWGTGSPRPRNGLMRLRASALRRMQWWLSGEFRGAVDAVRAGYGLVPLDVTVTEFAGTMPLYLMPSVPEFDYNRGDLPTSVKYVGPCSWDKSPNQLPPTWLNSLPENVPLIHVTEATIHSHDPFLLKAAARGLAGLPMQVVMTTGRHRDPLELDLGSLAPNIRVERYIPHSDLMPKTSVMVTLGGAGTVFAALKGGVPLIVVPTEWDKPENAQRVLESGAGLRIDPRRCTPERLRASVERVLREPSFHRNARRLADCCARRGGATEAAEHLIGLI